MAAATIGVILLATGPHAYNTLPVDFDQHGRMGPHALLTKLTVSLFVKILDESPSLVLPRGVDGASDQVAVLRNALTQCPEEIRDFAGCQNMVLWGAMQEDGDLAALELYRAAEGILQKDPIRDSDLRNRYGNPLTGDALAAARKEVDEVTTKSLRELRDQLVGQDVTGLLRFCNHFYVPSRPSYYPDVCSETTLLSGGIGELLKIRVLPDWLTQFRERLLPPPANAVDWAVHSRNLYAWPNAISAYRRDPHGGMKIIGHTLHLIQDMTVPLHVRGDIHPIDKDYEGFADLFSTRDWSRVTSGNAKLFAVYQDRIAESQWEGIQPLMRKLARYTAENFVSDDTMPNGAELKRMFEDDGRYVTRMPLAEERPYWWIVAANRGDAPATRIRMAERVGTIYRITGTVASDYWQILSLHAIENGLLLLTAFAGEALSAEESREPRVDPSSGVILEALPMIVLAAVVTCVTVLPVWSRRRYRRGRRID